MLRRMKCLRWIVHSALVWLYLSLPLIAQQNVKPFEELYPSLQRVYNFQRYTVSDGLSNGFCRALLLDSQGYL
jgi:hypothetical protein